MLSVVYIPAMNAAVRHTPIEHCIVLLKWTTHHVLTSAVYGLAAVHS